MVYTILLWEDLWNDKVLNQFYPEFFAKNEKISIFKAKNPNSLQLLFHLPLSIIAFAQL